MPHDYRDHEERVPPYNQVLVEETGVNASGGYSVPGLPTTIIGYRSVAITSDWGGAAASVEVGWTIDGGAGVVAVETKTAPGATPSTLLFINQGHTLHHVTITAGNPIKYSVTESNQLPLSPRAAPTAQCQLLGKGNGAGATLTLTLDTAVPAKGILHVVFAQTTIGDSADPGAPDAASDSNAVPGWVVSTGTDPLIGLTRESAGIAPPGVTSQVGSVARPCTAGDLGIGSTISVHFSTVDPGLFHTAGLIVYQHAYFVTVKQFGFATYGNNDTYPDVGATPNRLSWDTDYGPGTTTPDQDGVMITAMGAYPAVAGFAPFVGFLVGEIATGSVSIACACMPIAEGASPDPGGSWPSNALQLMGNYQYAQPKPYS